jgi:hypothetical protein
VYRIGKAIVRVHGETSREQLKKATEIFIRGVDNQKRKEANKATAKADGEVEAGYKSVAGY